MIGEKQIPDFDREFFLEAYNDRNRAEQEQKQCEQNSRYNPNSYHKRPLALFHFLTGFFFLRFLLFMR